jgi:2-dehydro-3-deoxyphosphogluconate aldolase/(4S)-4-hydroxy-2-oxoglutarate aldolase
MKARLQIVRRAAHPPEAAEVVARIGAAGLIAILRLPDIAGATATARALRETGVSALEVTLATPEALRGLRSLREAMGPDALLGVGSVLDVAGARAALEAGAQFLVTPSWTRG